MICIPLRTDSFEILLKNFRQAQKKADLIEIWFDELNRIDESKLKKLFEIKKKPIIYKSYSNINNLEQILKYRIAYIDIDIETEQSLINKVKKLSPQTKIIISHHDFEKTPSFEELKKISNKSLKKKADIVKIAAKANTFKDTLIMLNLLTYLSEKNQKAICISMGKEGKLSRIAGHLTENYLMYAAIDKDNKTAEGQMSIDELKKAQKLIS